MTGSVQTGGSEMIEKDKLKAGLIQCTSLRGSCSECPYEGRQCMQRLRRDMVSAFDSMEEVIHCKDCSFRDYGENEVDAWDRCKLHRINVTEEGFCFWAVRRK